MFRRIFNFLARMFRRLFNCFSSRAENKTTPNEEQNEVIIQSFPLLSVPKDLITHHVLDPSYFSDHELSSLTQVCKSFYSLFSNQLTMRKSLRTALIIHPDHPREEDLEVKTDDDYYYRDHPHASGLPTMRIRPRRF